MSLSVFFPRIIAQHYGMDSVEALRYTLRPTANLRLKMASRDHSLPRSVEKAAAASALIALISIVAPLQISSCLFVSSQPDILAQVPWSAGLRL